MRSAVAGLFLVAILAATALTASAGPAGDFGAVYKKGQGRLVEVMKIGGGPEEGEDDPVFYRPMTPTVGRDGTIYVIDYSTTEVSAFSPAGEFLFKFAKEGEGPGELRWPTDLAVDRAGRLVISESGNKRFSLFSPRGKFIKTVPYFADDVRAMEFMSDGRLVAEVGRSYMPSPAVMGTRWSVMVLDSTYQPMASLDSLTADMVVVQTSKGTTVATPPYGNYLVWSVGPDGRICFGKAGEYRVGVVDRDLKPVRTLSRSVPAVKISGEERKKYNDQMSAEIIAAVRFPDAKPPVEGLYFDPAGYLLVDRAVAYGAKAALLDIYRPDGSFLGEFSLPGLRSRPVFDNDTILMRVTSKEELPALVRYRLE